MFYLQLCIVSYRVIYHIIFQYTSGYFWPIELLSLQKVQKFEQMDFTST